MIANTSKHYDDDILQELLDETLAPRRAETIQSHLSNCGRCRDSLARLAADATWWDETIDVLGETTPAPAPEHADASPAVEWLMPLLDPAADGLGMLDRYPVAAVIGQGGMGVVLRAFDSELNRPVAVKVLSPHLAGVGAARARFMREAQAAAAIVHPSIVPIYSVVTSARLPYLVMPLVAGGNLQQRIDREGPLDLAEVLRIASQVAEGLAAAHDRGVIHRDIKPANLLIEEGNGRILISDFGLARALDDASLTCSGMIAGTPQYMSPEQARGEPLDARSDLFSLGSLIYAMATGRPPFRAENPLAVLKKITETSPRPIHQVNEQMPLWLDRLVGQLMTINRDSRITTADDSAALLRRALAHVAHPSANPLPPSLLTRRRPTKWIAIAATIGVGLVLGRTWIAEQVATAYTPTPKTTSFVSVPAVVDNSNITSPIDVADYDIRWTDPRIEMLLQTLRIECTKLEYELDSPHFSQGSQQ